MKYLYDIKSDSPIRARLGGQDSYPTYAEVKGEKEVNSCTLQVQAQSLLRQAKIS
jgi:hypothetical protein